MKKLILLLIIGAIGWQAYGKYKQRAAQEVEVDPPAVLSQLPKTQQSANSSFRCDGRTYCSQMTSCAEATWFLKNCPDTKMDGNNDGIPCERQWCK